MTTILVCSFFINIMIIEFRLVINKIIIARSKGHNHYQIMNNFTRYFSILLHYEIFKARGVDTTCR